MRGRRILVGAAVGVLLALLGLAGCGATTTVRDPAGPPETASGGPASSSPGTSAASLPSCARVWVAGRKLPGGYRGCAEGTRPVEPDARYCEFGKPLITYDARFYAVRGGRIAEAREPFRQDAGYQRVLRSCSG